MNPESTTKMSTQTQIEIKPAQKIFNPVRADCGTQYFSTFKYRVEGDVELYGDEWRTGKIIWQTTDAWKAAEERVKIELEEGSDDCFDWGQLDDESMACDWEEYEVQDENGFIMPDAAAKEVAALVES